MVDNLLIGKATKRKLAELKNYLDDHPDISDEENAKSAQIANLTLQKAEKSQQTRFMVLRVPCIE